MVQFLEQRKIRHCQIPSPFTNGVTTSKSPSRNSRNNPQAHHVPILCSGRSLVIGTLIPSNCLPAKVGPRFIVPSSISAASARSITTNPFVSALSLHRQSHIILRQRRRRRPRARHIIQFRNLPPPVKLAIRLKFVQQGSHPPRKPLHLPHAS